MQWWNVLTAGGVRQNESGQTLFFPNGVLGRGYVIAGERRARFTRWSYLILIYGQLAFIACFPLWPHMTRGVVVILALVVFDLIWARLMVRNLPALEGTQRWQDRLRDRAINVPAGFHWYGLIAGSLFCLVSLAVFLFSPWPARAVGALGLVFFAACTLMSLRFLRIRAEVGAERMSDATPGRPYTGARILTGIVALPLTAYGLLVAANQIRSGFDILGISLGSATLAAAAVCWWFALRGFSARDRAGMKYAVVGGLILGGTGFVLGFFGPILLTPSANQGPLLGIFITGPLGFLVGTVAGWIYGRIRSKEESGHAPARSPHQLEPK